VLQVDSAQIPSQRSRIPRFRPDVPVNRPDAQQSSNISPKDVVILSRLPLVSKNFELFKVASVRMSQQEVRTPFSVRQVKEFSMRTQIWEDSCNRSDDRSTSSGRQSLLWKLRAAEMQLSGH